MTQAELHDQIIQSLTRVETQVIDIKEQTVKIDEHLARLNGSVAKVVTDLAMHPYECEYGSKIVEIERQLATGDHPGSKSVEERLTAWNLNDATATSAKDAAVKTSGKWLAAIRPIIWIGGGALMYLLLTHLNDLLQYYGMKP
jgi:hypothetical protein